MFCCDGPLDWSWKSDFIYKRILTSQFHNQNYLLPTLHHVNLKKLKLLISLEGEKCFAV